MIQINKLCKRKHTLTNSEIEIPVMSVHVKKIMLEISVIEIEDF